MADTPWGDYTDATSLLGTDVLLAARGAGGVNFPALLLLRTDQAENYILGAFTPVVNDLRYFDLYNQDGGASAGAIMRLITKNAANSGLIAAGIVKYRSGPMVIYNDEPTTAASIGFNVSTAERMRIDGSGNVGIGTSAPQTKLDIAPYDGVNEGAEIKLRGSGAATVDWNIDIYQDDLRFFLSNKGSMAGFSGRIIFGLTHASPFTDNSITSGKAANRWSTVYAATGTINTSDAREKAWRGGLSDADIRAGRRIIRELGWYQWLAEIERKGEDGARLHFGVRAQEVIRILIDEGIESAQEIDLPADQFIPEGERPSLRSAFLCFDTWEEEWQDEYETVTRTERRAVATPSASVLGPDGQPAQAIEHEEVEIEQRVPTGAQILVRPAGNRFGLRTDQLTLFLIAVQDAVQAAIEARLEAIEAA